MCCSYSGMFCDSWVPLRLSPYFLFFWVLFGRSPLLEILPVVRSVKSPCVWTSRSILSVIFPSAFSFRVRPASSWGEPVRSVCAKGRPPRLLKVYDQVKTKSMWAKTCPPCLLLRLPMCFSLVFCIWWYGYRRDALYFHSLWNDRVQKSIVRTLFVLLWS